MPSYFKRYYLDDVKLAQRALLEFHRALQSGQMIAFTGAMTTEGRGYGTWTEMVQTYGRIASVAKASPGAGIPDLARLIAHEDYGHHRSIERILAYREDTGSFDVRVALGLMEEAVIGHEETGRRRSSGGAGTFELDRVTEPVDALSVALAEYFRVPRRRDTVEALERDLLALLRKSRSGATVDTDVVRALLRSLGIRRFATLNYDFEIERQTGLAATEHASDSPFDRLRELRDGDAAELFNWSLDSGRIRRVLGNGQAVESDILNRERIDRMLEFAVGADDVHQHIMHMHGRACDPASMILSYRDYDRLYRRNDLYKLPFEFAQRIMIGGNPVLFVGLGMSETEVNQALQDFVSSSPYQRMAPTFLLWNHHRPRGEAVTERDWREIELRRLDRFHRLGVLTIFDVDLEAMDCADPCIDIPRRVPGGQPATTEGITKMHNLRWLVDNVRPAAARVAAREDYRIARDWRNMGDRLRSAHGPKILWEVVGGESGVMRDYTKAMQCLGFRLSADRAERIAIIGPQGSGHGALAYQVAQNADAFGFDLDNVLLINAGFSFDTDNILDGISRFLLLKRPDASPVTGVGPVGRPKMSRASYFSGLRLSKGKPLLIVIGGTERLFGTDGRLLSAELDELFDLLRQGVLPGVSCVLFGSERVSGYAERRRFVNIDSTDFELGRLADPDAIPFERMEAIRLAFRDAMDASDLTVEGLAPALAAELTRKIGAMRIPSKRSGDSIELREAFFNLYLGNVFMETLGADARLALELLKVLAFIGLPVEADVLEHVPRVCCAAASSPGRDIRALLARLADLKLVIAVKGCDGDASHPRFTLPRCLLAELRARNGVPLSEARLSTSFNMSLYIAQPVDGAMPEPEIHDELGNLIDHLLGAYRDGDDQPCEKWRPVLERVGRKICPHERPGRTRERDGREARPLAEEIHALCRPGHTRRLRAALALVRGYYTTTGLLTLDEGDRLIREDRDGILLEHAERLDCLIDAYGKVAMARDELRDEPDFTAEYGTVEPFYPDEIVWLHNERGVVRLAMGDLIEAAVSFDRAFDINRRHVECQDRAHNWRRIRLNQILVDLERGETGVAQRKVDEILKLNPGRDLDDVRLAAAIAHGYAGRAHHIEGDVDSAVDDYEQAVDGLRALNEKRALAYFLGWRAAIVRPGRDVDQAQDLREATDLAQAALQLDIAYHLRVMSALGRFRAQRNGPPGVHGSDAFAPQRLLDEAMRYALQTDVHWIRVEAGAAQAEVKLATGDHEGALRGVSDALMVATRFGMELHKILLRSLMARILAARGHPITAVNLALTTIKIASRRKYQAAIAHAEETLLTTPRVASMIDLIDASVRRAL